MIRRLGGRRRRVEVRRRAVGTDLQRLAVELALAAPFLSLRHLTRWRARVATWQRAAGENAALLARLDGLLARYTAGRDAARTASA